jgi:hypothetical protein
MSPASIPSAVPKKGQSGALLCSVFQARSGHGRRPTSTGAPRPVCDRTNGRSPGSRVLARHRLPGDRPSGIVAQARRLQLRGQPRSWNALVPHRIPCCNDRSCPSLNGRGRALVNAIVRHRLAAILADSIVEPLPFPRAARHVTRNKGDASRFAGPMMVSFSFKSTVRPHPAPVTRLGSS